MMPLSPAVFGQDREDLLERRDAGDDPVREVRPVEARDMDPRLLHAQERDDVVADPGGRGGRQGDERHVRELPPQDGQLAILRPEIMAPLGDAVRFVDGDQTDVPGFQGPQHVVGHEAFRRQVEDLVPAAAQVPPSPSVLVGRQRRIEERRRHADLFEAVDLVLHQGDQGRNDDREPVVGDRRKLIAQRLAAARGKERQDIMPREKALDDFPLVRAKRLETEMTLQDRVDAGPLRVNGY